MDRRQLLATAAVLPALSACSFLQKVSAVDPQKVADNLSVVSKAISTVEGDIKKLTVIPFDVRTKVVGWIDDLRTRANSFRASLGADAVKTLVQNVGADLDAAAALAKPYLPTTAAGVFSDASTVLAVVKTLVGIASVVALAPSEAEYEAALARLRLVAR